MSFSINHTYQSPNFDDRGDSQVDMLVMHYTDMAGHEAALTRLCDADAKVSAHYLIAQNGEVFQMVDEAARAWHAGVSEWRGHHDINARSIGIELCYPGHQAGLPEFPKPQMQALLTLSQAILSRHSIPARNVQGHSDIAFLRKADPGENFDWAFLAAHGVGLFPTGVASLSGHEHRRGDKGEEIMRLQQSLANWGYGLKIDGLFGEKTEACVVAFQRHYTQKHMTGMWNGRCAGILAALHAMV